MGDTVLQVEDIMQSFAQLSESSLKFAFESLNESKTTDTPSASSEESNTNTANTTTATDESKKPTTTTSNGESTTAAENNNGGDKLQVIVKKFDYLPIIQSSIRDESYNWLMSIPNAEQFAKIIGCTLDKVPTVLKSRKDIRATLDTLTTEQLKEALALLGLDQDTGSSEIMIPKIEEEMMMQGIFKLLTKLDKKTLSSFCTDLKIKYHDNLLSLCDTIMSTMYDLEESPDSSTTNTNTPTTPTIATSTINSPPPTNNNNTTTTTTTTTTASSTPAATIKSPTKAAPVTTTNGESPSKSKKKNTPTKSPKSTTTKITSPTPTTTPPTTTTTIPVQSPPQTSTTAIKTETEEPKKLGGRSSLNKPSSDRSLIPVVPGKRERKPLPPDPVLSPPEVIKSTRVRGGNNTNNKITTTTTTAIITTTTTTTNGKRKRGTRGLPPLNSNDYEDEEQEADKKQVKEEEEEGGEETNSSNSNNRNNSNSSNNGNHNNGDNDENMGEDEDEDEHHNNHNNSGELDSSLVQQHQENVRKGGPSLIGYYGVDKKWVCPSFDLITKGVEKSFLQNNFNLSDLARYCKLNNLAKTKTKAQTIKQILLFASTGSIPTAPTSNKKKKSMGNN